MYQNIFPGKVILTGEHSVIYGSRVLTVAINNYRLLLKIERKNELIKDKLIFCQTDDVLNSFVIEKKSIDLKFLNIWKDFNNIVKEYQYDSLLFKDNLLIELHKIIHEYKTQFNQDDISLINKQQFILMFSFISNYLYNKGITKSESDIINRLIVNCKDNKDFINLEIKSNIPLGAGLGSSAAFSLSLADSIMFILNSLFDNLFDKDECQKLTRALSFIGETFMHFKTTGADLVACESKGLVLFKNYYTFEILDNMIYNQFFDKIRIFLLNTNIQRSAFNLVKKVSTTMNPDSLKNMKIISEQIIENFLNISNNKEEKFDYFFKLISQNQELLKEIGVSNEIIDNIILSLNQEGISCKITGAGGGGHLIAFVSKEKEDLFRDKCLKDNISFNQVEIFKS